MATIYPERLDTDLEIPRVDNNITEVGGDAINSLRDAVFAIESAIGVDPQGNKPSLVDRINSVIDDNGNIKASALAARGLVTLPINDSHIGETAGIQESKLDLDFSTTFLKGRIDSNVSDLNAVTDSFNAFVGQTNSHFAGDSDRHDGYDIDLTNSVRDADDVESALHVINNAFTAHENTTVNVHTASGISVNNEFQSISAVNVQEALVELDNVNLGTIDVHQDALHDSAIAINIRGHQGDQGNLSETVFASTIYQTDTSEATNILQVMRPNVARVTSKNIDPRSLEFGVAHNLRVAAGGINRSPLDINLSAIIPTEDTDTIVSEINKKARESHYPISAYNTGGKLTIAHNIPGEQFTIQILDTVSFSAASALGFGDVLSTVFSWSNNNHSAFIGGAKVLDFKSFIKRSHVHSSTSDTISLGLGDLSDFGLDNNNTGGGEGRILCHITNHSVDSNVNGTYYIVTYPTTSTFILNDSILAGTFDIEIAADATNFRNSSNGEVFDIFLEHDEDGYCIVTKSKRVAYGPIAGVNIRAVSETFPNSDIEWQVIDTSSIKFIQDGQSGNAVDIPTGFVGQLTVYDTDNTNSALIEVTGSPAAGNPKFALTMTPFAGTDDSLYISSVHYSGNFGTSTLKFVTDRRKIGGTVENQTNDKLKQIPFEESIRDLRNNGIVRGFDIISSGGSSFRLRGGRAYVDGRRLDVPTKEIIVTDLTPSRKLLLLDRDGNYVIKSEFDPGYSFSELTENDSYGDNRGFATILEFDTDGTALDGYFFDRRLLIGKLDKKILNNLDSLTQRVVNIENSAAGSFWGVVDAYQDAFLANISLANNVGFDALDDIGFSGGDNLVTTRRFGFDSPLVQIQKKTMFRSLGLTHINLFVEVRYTGENDGAFGASEEFSLQIGSAFDVGYDSVTTTEDYVTVKTIDNQVLPSTIVKERYVISIPLDLVNVPNHSFFDVKPRVKIIGSTNADGGAGGDVEPLIQFFNMRIVSSSYSIAGNILEEDGSTSILTTTLGDVL